jgi:predicted transcriptional regulator
LTGTNREEALVYVVMDGEKIEAMRQERGWSRFELAVAAGLSEASVRNVERGANNVRLETARRLGMAYGVRPQELGRPARKA